ncbi:hypothetical protein [Endozoicomonas sp. GU-1]|uniref:hypothetical protein n=1 Tax=Endozoicomonas sp. GU-1 TaxID=3009078 RepID=UPI0022B2C6A4|nr:hypothetical protein [Endozoicomonas sp. GU-1]WBA83168.1 hypothetical protein O2T12_08655 [Endozoicomonas sp. GU-1]WBA86093.1 hypothetical protein O3276_23280 [Endozoicomonas sp. GU-1]
MSDPIVGNPALNLSQNAQNNEWTCVSWFKKISDAVASKTSLFFGRVVAALVTVVTFIPSLGVDLVYAAKSLYDRKITKLQAPAPNLPVIPGAKVQWRRYIHDDDVKATMERYDRFLAENLTHHPNEIPKAAEQQLDKAAKGNIPIELITEDGVKTVKLHKGLGGGGSKTFYDIGDGQALAMIKTSYQFYDELMMLRYLEKLGIPTNEIKPAVIRWEFESTKYTKATYIAPSFSEYPKQNAFVVDHKDCDKLAGQLNGRKVLPAGQDAFKLENWDEVLNPLVNDIRTLIDNGISTLGDACNAILVGKGNKFHSGGQADFEARAFPFDFSSKAEQYDQLPVIKRLKAKEEQRTLKAYIEQVVFVQYDAKACFLPEKWKELAKDLTKRYLRRRNFL